MLPLWGNLTGRPPISPLNISESQRNTEVTTLPLEHLLNPVKANRPSIS